jgi:hypothetical protein
MRSPVLLSDTLASEPRMRACLCARVKWALIQEHMARLYQGAKAIDMDIGMPQNSLQQLLYQTVDANGMSKASGVHIRLMVTRGLKPTPYQNPNTTIGSPTIVIIPEWKEASQAAKEQVCALIGWVFFWLEARRVRSYRCVCAGGLPAPLRLIRKLMVLDTAVSDSWQQRRIVHEHQRSHTTVCATLFLRCRHHAGLVLLHHLMSRSDSCAQLHRITLYLLR